MFQMVQVPDPRCHTSRLSFNCFESCSARQTGKQKEFSRKVVWTHGACWKWFFILFLFKVIFFPICHHLGMFFFPGDKSKSKSLLGNASGFCSHSEELWRMKVLRSQNAPNSPWEMTTKLPVQRDVFSKSDDVRRWRMNFQRNTPTLNVKLWYVMMSYVWFTTCRLHVYSR